MFKIKLYLQIIFKIWHGQPVKNYTGTWTLRNMLAPLLASIRAISWGVETIKAPAENTCEKSQFL